MTRRKPLAGIYQLTTFLALVLLLLILFISAAAFFVKVIATMLSGLSTSASRRR